MHRFVSALIAMVVIPVLVAVGALVVVLRVVDEELDGLERFATASAHALQTERLKTEGEQLGRMVRGYLLVPDAPRQQEVRTSAERFEASLRQLTDMRQSPEERALVEAVSLADGRLRTVSWELMELRQQGVPLERIQARFVGELVPARLALDGALQAVVLHQQAEMEAAKLQARQRLGGSVRVYLLSVPLAVGVLVLLVVMVVREVQQRREAQETAERNAARLAASEARFAGIIPWTCSSRSASGPATASSSGASPRALQRPGGWESAGPSSGGGRMARSSPPRRPSPSWR